MNNGARSTRLAALALAGLFAGMATAQQAAGCADSVIGTRFVRVPAGEFWMGSDEPAHTLAAAFPLLERSRFDMLGDEAPVHRVRITRPFCMGRFEVTVGEFRRFVALSGHVAESDADGTGGYGWRAGYDPAASPRGDAFEGRDPRYSWRDPGFPQGDAHPVVNITWNDATALAAWLSRREGRRFRLPTEAEWEYAARAGSTGRFHSGDDPASLAAVANVFDQAAVPLWPRWAQHALATDDGHAFTAPVGRFAPNAFGLHDMHGNAWEWVSDWHADGYYAVSPVDDPQGPADGTVRVRRGGSWHTWAFYARSAYRNWNAPGTRYPLVGMRLVVEPD